jgi:2,3-bisphosphoglycerate-dependent phosphoglycerate mutase
VLADIGHRYDVSRSIALPRRSAGLNPHNIGASAPPTTEGGGQRTWQAEPVASPETHLFLIRHGESRAQVKALLSGHDTCTGLSDRGRRQAEALRDRLAKTRELADIDVLYTSILPRTIETAEIIAPALGGPAPQSECEWCEIHAGEAEGLTFPEFQERYPALGHPDDPFRDRIPGGETWAEFSVRVGARLGRVPREHPGRRVAVVGHGGTISASFVALGDLSIRQATALTSATVNTSITEWRHSGSGWRLIRYNDAAHVGAD